MGSGLASAPGWWGAVGRAGWLPDGDLGTGFPWTLAGLAAGAWTLEEVGCAPAGIPAPGVVGAQGALAWHDSISVVAGEGGAWEGFDAALARARAGQALTRRPAEGWLPRADLVLTSGSRGLSDHALSLWRGDSLGGLRVGAASGERAGAGGIAGAGRDLYDLAGVRVLGAHQVGAAFAHRRSSASLAGGEAQEVRGESASGEYRYGREPWTVAATFVRGYDRHDSLQDGLPERRRVADATATALELERTERGARWGLRGSWSDVRVSRAAGVGARDRARAGWGAARWQGPFGEGRLDVALGLGRHTGVDRNVLAPSIAWRFSRAPWEGRMLVERLLTPVWADLAAGERAFLQDTWASGLEVGARARGRGRARLTFLAGHTRNRAVLARIPLETLALRAGYRADSRAYDFGLLTGEALWRARRWAAGLEGFALTRDASPLQPRVDPGRGGRVFVEAAAALFGGDLRVRPRVDVGMVGPRESEAQPSRRLSGYATFAAGLQVTLADAAILIEGRNLEDRARAQTWVDGATGTEALGPGRELRFTFNWRLWN